MSSTNLFSNTYYIDFENGANSNSGLSNEQAWKDCPGDINATENALNTKLKAGDIVQFKSGVRYRGSIKVNESGTKEQPIQYRGEGWGAGKAILDGSVLIDGWQTCESDKLLENHPHKDHLFKTKVKISSPFLLNLHELSSNHDEDQFLWISQQPNPKDPFFFNKRDSFFPVKHSDLSTESIRSNDIFKQEDSNHWNGSSILIWTNPNATIRREIKSFHPSENKITFEPMKPSRIYPDKRDQYFSIYNSIHAIDKPGEYYVSSPDHEGYSTIYLWPKDNQNLNNRISRSIYTCGFDLGEQSQIHISGFQITKYAGAGKMDGCGIKTANRPNNGEGIIIKNNHITHNLSSSNGYGGIFLSGVSESLVENNLINYNLNHSGIFLSKCKKSIVRKNNIEFPGATALRIYTCEELQLLENTISNAYATHANGITIYIASKNILIYKNRITESTNPITFQDSGPIYFINNYVDGHNKFRNVCEWGNTSRGPWSYGDIVFINNSFIRSKDNTSMMLGSDPKKKYTLINNILDGLSLKYKLKPDITKKHNIYTGLNWTQKEKYNWKFSVNEALEKNEAKLFTSHKANQYEILQEGAAFNAGMNIKKHLPDSIFKDFNFKTLLESSHIGYTDKL